MRIIRAGIVFAALAAMLALPGTAFGGILTAPTASTDDVSQITATSAWFGGQYNNGAQQVTYHWDYATDAEFTATGTYDQATPLVADNIEGVPWVVPLDERVGERIAGLTPNTTYHVRFVAQNASGTAFGQDVTFTTPAN